MPIINKGKSLKEQLKNLFPCERKGIPEVPEHIQNQIDRTWDSQEYDYSKSLNEKIPRNVKENMKKGMFPKHKPVRRKNANNK